MLKYGYLMLDKFFVYWMLKFNYFIEGRNLNLEVIIFRGYNFCVWLSLRNVLVKLEYELVLIVVICLF